MSSRSLILLTFLIGFAIAVVFSTLGALWAQQFDLWSELGKAGVQLGVIVVGGAVLTTVLKTSRPVAMKGAAALRSFAVASFATS